MYYSLRPGARLALLSLTTLSSALQVTPNSPCSSVCVDDVKGDLADLSNSNTYPSDISCNNADYTATPAGIKFRNCVSCLQTSSYTNIPESDQSWFMYNLRYTVDWCVFGYPGNKTIIGGPCITSEACEPLAKALQDGSLSPNVATAPTYGYCTADNGAFLGDSLSRCTSCLQQSSQGHSYLANFLVALQAGCIQQPQLGMVVGLNETVFSDTLVAIASPSRAASSSSSVSSSMSVGAKIGITVAGIILLLMLAGVIIICFKKRQRRKAINHRLGANYVPRLGSLEISLPQARSFTDLYTTRPRPTGNAPAAPPYAEGRFYDNLPKAYVSPPVIEDAKSGPNTPLTNSPPTIPIPVHRAYIPKRRPSAISIESDSTSISSSAAPSANPTPKSVTSFGRSPTYYTRSRQASPTSIKSQNRARPSLSPWFLERPPYPAEPSPSTLVPSQNTSPLQTPKRVVTAISCLPSSPASNISQYSPSFGLTPIPTILVPQSQQPPYEQKKKAQQVPIKLDYIPNPNLGVHDPHGHELSAVSEDSVEQWPGSM